MNYKIGFEAVQLLSSAESVDELDHAVRVINNAYQIIRGQIEIIEVLRDGEHKMVEEDNKNIVFKVGEQG